MKPFLSIVAVLSIALPIHAADAVVWRDAPVGAYHLYATVAAKPSNDLPIYVECIDAAGRTWGSALTRVIGDGGPVFHYVSKAGPDWKAGIVVTVSIRRASGTVEIVGKRLIARAY